MRVAFVLYAGLDPGARSAPGAASLPAGDWALHQATGGTIYDRHLVAGLRALGDEVDVLPLARGPMAAVRAAVRGLGRTYDVVLEDELVHPSLFWLPRHRPGPVRVALVHNLGSLQPGVPFVRWAQYRERRYLLGVDAVIAVCRDTLEGVMELREGGEGNQGALPPLPTVIATAGRDHLDPQIGEEDVVQRAAQPGPLRALFVGAVAPHKGLRRLLSVLQPADAAWLRLDVAGSLTADWRYAVSVRAEIESRGLGQLVFLRGPQDPAALGTLYRQSHVLVLPSDRESYPLVGIEALGHGLVPFLTDLGGTAELVRAGQGGFLLSPQAPARWRDELHRLHQQRGELAEQARLARARFFEHKTWLETARSVQAFCHELLRARPAA